MGSLISKSDVLPDKVVLANRIALGTSTAIIATGVMLGKHDVTTHPVRMIRIAVFGGVFGLQLWNSLIGGTTLFFSIPRHTFGEAQTYLLPAYFNTNMVLSSLALGIHLYYNPYSAWSQCERMFTTVTSTTIACYMLQSFCLMSMNLRRMNKLFAKEKEAGYGQEVGVFKYEKLKDDEEYKKLKKSFGMAHGLSNTVNLLSIGMSIVQLVYFAQHGF